jgi:transcriptional regulator
MPVVDYPPAAYRVTDPAVAFALMRAHPFAHVITAHAGLRVTRLPMLADVEHGRVTTLRGHFDARNPQAEGLQGTSMVVSFSGPAAYVSPHWRMDKSRGGTYDYEEVQVRGKVRVMQEAGFFTQLIDDLSALIEPQHAEISDQPVWRTSMAKSGHIDRQLSLVVPFIVDVESVEAVAKLHQGFSPADRRSVAEHLARSHRDEVRAIGAKIRQGLT